MEFATAKHLAELHHGRFFAFMFGLVLRSWLPELEADSEVVKGGLVWSAGDIGYKAVKARG